MKRILCFLLTILMLFALCACNKNDNTQTPTTAPTTAPSTPKYNQLVDGTEIIGTWVCKDISKDCYFVFDEKGDAYAYMGSSTVYGYYDFYADENLLDISLPNLLFNEYTASYNDEELILTSDESQFKLKRATKPEITIKKPDDLIIDYKLIGDWQSQDSSECYRFNEDTTSVITDIMNDATLDCYYTCNDGKITMYYMASETKDSTIELTYSFENDKLNLNGLIYEKVN